MAVAAQPSAADVIAAGMKYGPNAGLAIQRSQYLANALQSLEAQAGQNIRTPTALWSNLLADGITQWGKNRADKEAMTAYSTDRAAQARADLDALGPSDVPVPAVPPPQAAASPVPAGPAVPPAAVASAPVQIGGAPTSPPPAASNSPTPDQIKLAQMVWGEARGEPPEGQQAVAAVALNRAAKGYGGAKSLADVLEAPHQFEGLTPKARAQTPDKLAAILANIQPELNGADPTGGAVNFLNPTLQAQLGRPQPAWAQGPSQTFGHQAFYGGNPQLAQAAPPHPPLMGAMGMGAQPFPPAPPPPAPVTPQAGAPPAAPPASPGVSAAGGAAPMAPPQGMAPPQAPQGPQGVPTGLAATPQERALIQRLQSDPRTFDQAHALSLEIQRRMAEPQKPEIQMVNGVPVLIDPYRNTTRAVPVPQSAMTQTGPGALPGSYKMTSPTGAVSFANEQNLTGPPPAGYDRDPANPQHLILQGTGAPPPGTNGAPAPAGKAPIPPALQKTYMDFVDAFHKGPGYTDYTNSVNAANALEANLKASLGNNTVVDQTAVDATIRAMTGLSARQGSVNSVIDHLPWSEQLKGFVQHAIGEDGKNGYVTPKVLQQFRTAVHAYAEGHRPLAQQEYDAYNSGANRMGFDMGQSLPGVTPQMPVKWLDEGQGGPAADPQSAQHAAVAAEIARRKAAGTWKGH